MRIARTAGLLTACLLTAYVASAASVRMDGHVPGEWTMDLDAAQAYAKEHNRAIFMAFSGSDWCGWCRMMDRNVFQRPAWRKYAEANLVLVLIDFPRDKTLVPAKYVQRNNQLKNEYGIDGFPTYVLLDGETGGEAARLGAARDATPESMIAQVREAVDQSNDTDVPPLVAVDSRQEEAIVKALREFGKADPEKRREMAATTLGAITQTLDRDPVMLVLLDPGALIGMVPYLGLKDLEVLAKHLDKARKTGTPIDGFQRALVRLAETRTDDLSATRAIMFLYSKLGDPQRSLELLPELEVLKQADTAEVAKEFIVVLKGVGKPATALALALHKQNTSESADERKTFCLEILNLADQAEDAFLTEWLTRVADSPDLLDTLRGELGKRAATARSIGNAAERTRLLMGHIRIVGLLCQTAPTRELARQYLRHWQFEFANSLARYRGPAKPQRRTSRPRTPPPFVPFPALRECRLSPECMLLLPMAEAELHAFQIAVARLKTGEFDENALRLLTAYNKKYPASVAAHCAAFIEDWARKVNPNKNRDPRQRQQQQGGGIPLTRARQERNLTECSRMFEIMRDAGVSLPDGIMLQGFRSCFSKAEIVSREAVLRVFPDVSALSDGFIARLAADVMGEMRQNWMNPENRQKLQQQYATNRTEKDIDNETVRAYRGMIELVEQRLAVSTDSIPLRTIMAALSFDLAEFSRAVGLSSLEEYTELRDSTFRMFEECYEIYKAGIPELSRNEYSVDYLKYWFSTVFGVSDLGSLEVNVEENPSQLERVKASLDAMEEPYRDLHKGLFGDWIVGQWPRLKPHVKLTVLQSTLEVLGEHRSVASLVERMADYKELLREVELLAEVDGSTTVGSGRAFGVVLKIRHTDALEREAGGFRKYVQNQHAPYPGSRDKVDYRNRLAENIEKALKDSFDVTGITWMDRGLRSVPSRTPHWRETPIAYISLRALDATVDRIPSIQIDMDFKDNTGQVVLPVLSSTVLVDAAAEDPPPRPFGNVEISLLLDTRQASDREIKLEVAMTGEGILPPPADILRPAPGYSFGPAGDEETLILKLEQRDGKVVAHSEQNAVLPLKWNRALQNEVFRFPEVTLQGATVDRQQYRDADIVPADETVRLATGRSAGWAPVAWAIPVIAIALAAGFLIRANRRTHRVQESADVSFALPAKISGLSVLSLLERIRRSDRLVNSADQAALTDDVRRIEEACFSPNGKRDIDLEQVAGKWLRHVS